jgi:hypothetical protein
MNGLEGGEPGVPSGRPSGCSVSFLENLSRLNLARRVGLSWNVSAILLNVTSENVTFNLCKTVTSSRSGTICAASSYLIRHGH